MAKATAARKPKEQKPKQERFDGFEQKEIKEVRESLEVLKEKVDIRMADQKEEERAQDEALRVMERNKINEYRLGNYIFHANEGKRKVKRVKVQEKDGEAEGNETDGLDGGRGAAEQE